MATVSSVLNAAQISELAMLYDVTPALSREHKSSGNHPGLMKSWRDHATRQPQAAEGGYDQIASGSAADGRLRQSIPCGIKR